MKWLSILFLIVVLILPSISCHSEQKAALAELKELETQVEIEADEFDKLLNELVTYINSITLPSDISLKPLVPDDWLFEICEWPDIPEKLYYVLGIPAPEGIETGLSVIEEGIAKRVWGRTTYLKPKTYLYVVSELPYKYQYAFLTIGTPSDFRDYPKQTYVDCFPSLIIVLSPYYIPPNVTHGLYVAAEVKPLMGEYSHYRLTEIVGQMPDANPYLNKTQLGEYETSNLFELTKELQGQIDIISEDRLNIVSVINELAFNYFKPNSWCWDKQDELDKFRESMDIMHAELSEVEDYLYRINNWDYSNLERYHELQ